VRVSHFSSRGRRRVPGREMRKKKIPVSEVPGMAEMMRADNQSRVPTAMLSRAVVGICGSNPR
jgi:hypothetical protein